jgi:hypothetical protein
VASDGGSETFTRIELLREGIVVKTWTPNTKQAVVEYSTSASNGDYCERRQTVAAKTRSSVLGGDRPRKRSSLVTE